MLCQITHADQIHALWICLTMYDPHLVIVCRIINPASANASSFGLDLFMIRYRWLAICQNWLARTALFMKVMNSDQSLISPHSVTISANKQVMRRNKMIPKYEIDV